MKKDIIIFSKLKADIRQFFTQHHPERLENISLGNAFTISLLKSFCTMFDYDYETLLDFLTDYRGGEL